MTKKEILKLSALELDKSVKIQGTDYDRKRVVTSKIRNKIKALSAKGKSDKEIAEKLNINLTTILYNTDPEYRRKVLERGQVSILVLLY